MRIAMAGLFGLVFGAGLAVSNMLNPARVLNFLDVFGSWDPTLAFVLGGAVAVSTVGFAVARHRSRSWLGEPLSLPMRRDIDARLLGGATLFGVGWGLVGLCPGPALANLGRDSSALYVFIASMLVGIWLHRLLSRPHSTPLPGAAPRVTDPSLRTSSH